MKALETVISPGLGAKRACQTKWELFLEAESVDPAEAPSPVNHCRLIPWEGGSWAPSMAEAGTGAKAEAAGKQVLSLRKLVRAANRRTVLSGKHHWNGNKDFSVGQERLGSVAVTNEPQTTRLLPTKSPFTCYESIVGHLGALIHITHT